MPSTTTQTDDQAQTDRFSKGLPWYQKSIENFGPAGRELLENYSHIPPDEIDSHVLEMRDRAWTIVPYPCIGMFRFLNLSISNQPCYSRILSLLKEPQSQHTLLDLGCCFAQDIRKLTHDGVPSENLYACDIEQSFLDLSYDLFKDRDTMKAHFFTADVFDENSNLNNIDGQIDVVYLASFLHIFSWDDQLKICKRVVKTLRPQKGSTVFGRMTARVIAGEVRTEGMKFGRDSSAWWRHDVDSFTKLWDLVGQEMGSKWKTWARLDRDEGMGSAAWGEKETRQMKFEVVRVD